MRAATRTSPEMHQSAAATAERADACARSAALLETIRSVLIQVAVDLKCNKESMPVLTCGGRSIAPGGGGPGLHCHARRYFTLVHVHRNLTCGHRTDERSLFYLMKDRVVSGKVLCGTKAQCSDAVTAVCTLLDTTRMQLGIDTGGLHSGSVWVRSDRELDWARVN